MKPALLRTAKHSLPQHSISASLAIIGLKHSGKTGHGRRLAEYAGVPFFDLDDCILRAHSGNQPAVSSPPAYDAADHASERGSEPGLITNVLDKYLKQDHLKNAEKEGYLCGSPGMLDACMVVMRNNDMDDNRIYFDKFA